MATRMHGVGSFKMRCEPYQIQLYLTFHTQKTVLCLSEPFEKKKACLFVRIKQQLKLIFKCYKSIYSVHSCACWSQPYKLISHFPGKKCVTASIFKLVGCQYLSLELNKSGAQTDDVAHRITEKKY